MNKRVDEILSKLTLEEKAKLCSGKNFWELESVADLPSIMVTDGPHGLRKQETSADHIGLSQSVKATCYPTAVGLAATWDNNLVYKLGEHLGEECLTENVSVLLGPGANIKRHPLCGRNFEYLSEDPILTGYISSSLISGIQSKGIGTSLKHYVANNQENMRMSVDTFIDERTLREIYLKGFEIAVKNAQPWTVMCSYNKVNGEYLSENKKLLQNVLKNEWEHKGIVVTDWGACNDRVKGLEAGQDLEMPGPSKNNTRKIIDAVKNGTLDEKVLDSRVERILDLIIKSSATLQKDVKPYNKDEHHDFARHLAAESTVLLKNDDNILPLNKKQTVALIGEFAVKPRYQGSGSSLINPSKITNALDAFTEVLGDKVTFAQGYNSKSDIVDLNLITEAVEIAKKSEVVVVMVGLTEVFESEGFDREHLNMPSNHLKLVEELVKVNDNIIVALSNGSPVLLPFKNKVSAIVESYLGGQASGEALADIIFGNVNPSGKLAETFPNNIDEIPASKNFPGKPRQVEYREGLYVGYRYYNTVGLKPLYPFGYGLSYTTFKYSDFKVESKEEIIVKLNVKNTGKVAGKEIVQVYLSKPDSGVYRPSIELKGYSKVNLKPNEQKEVVINIPLSDLKVYTDGFKLEEGTYTLKIGSSSDNIHFEQNILLKGEKLQDDFSNYKNINNDFNPTQNQFEELLEFKIPDYPSIRPFTMNSVIGEMQGTIVGRLLKKALLKNITKMVDGEANEALAKMAETMMNQLPFRALVMMSDGAITYNRAIGLLDMMNRKPLRGLFKTIKG